MNGRNRSHRRNLVAVVGNRQRSARRDRQRAHVMPLVGWFAGRQNGARATRQYLASAR